MALTLRINFVDVVCDESLRNRIVNGAAIGYEFKIRLSNYRGDFLSCIETFEVETDGESVPPELITFSINGKEFFVSQLPDLTSEYWDLIDPAIIAVYQRGGLRSGEHHIAVKLIVRIPYLPLPGADGQRSYVPLDSCGEKILTLSDERGV